MKFKFVLFVALCVGLCCSTTLASSRNNATEYTVRGQNAGHTVVVEFRKQRFQKGMREVQPGVDRPPDINGTLVNGKKAWGTDGEAPVEELAAINVRIDGKRVAIPRKSFADCFEPFFSERRVFAWIDSSGKTACIKAIFGGAAGQYQVTWWVSTDRKVKRQIWSRVV